MLAPQGSPCFEGAREQAGISAGVIGLLPSSQVAVPNLGEAVQDADLLVFVIPHQFIHKICDEITGRVPKKAVGITLIKVSTMHAEQRRLDSVPPGFVPSVLCSRSSFPAKHLTGSNFSGERVMLAPCLRQDSPLWPGRPGRPGCGQLLAHRPIGRDCGICWLAESPLFGFVLCCWNSSPGACRAST